MSQKTLFRDTVIEHRIHIHTAFHAMFAQNQNADCSLQTRFGKEGKVMEFKICIAGLDKS